MTKNSTSSTARQYSYRRRIGSTVYRVNVVIPTEGTETMEEKILRMIRNEGSANGPECGIMSVPQVSPQSERSA